MTRFNARRSLSFRSARTLLEDIWSAAELTRRFIVGYSFEQYAADEKTMAAVERQLLIVSEAAKRLGAEVELRVCYETHRPLFCGTELLTTSRLAGT